MTKKSLGRDKRRIGDKEESEVEDKKTREKDDELQKAEEIHQAIYGFSLDERVKENKGYITVREHEELISLQKRRKWETRYLQLTNNPFRSPVTTPGLFSFVIRWSARHKVRVGDALV